MNKQTRQAVPELKIPERPSLYGDGVMEGRGGFSILEGLEPRRRQWRASRMAWWGLLLAMVGTGVAILSNLRMTQSIYAPHLRADVGNERPQAVKNVVSQLAAVSPAVSSNVDARPMVIEASPGEDGAETPVLVGERIEPAVASTGDVAGNHADDAGADSGIRATNLVPAASHQTAAGKSKKEAAHVLARPSTRDAKSERKSAQQTTKNPDKDVELIAALLSHLSGPAKRKNEVNSRPRAKDESDSLKHTRPADQNKEVVMRDSGEPLDSLVKRCKALGMIEGELCRLRICSGMWGKDPACPAGPNSASGVQ